MEVLQDEAYSLDIDVYEVTDNFDDIFGRCFGIQITLKEKMFKGCILDNASINGCGDNIVVEAQLDIMNTPTLVYPITAIDANPSKAIDINTEAVDPSEVIVAAKAVPSILPPIIEAVDTPISNDNDVISTNHCEATVTAKVVSSTIPPSIISTLSTFVSVKDNIISVSIAIINLIVTKNVVL